MGSVGPQEYTSFDELIPTTTAQLASWLGGRSGLKDDELRSMVAEALTFKTRIWPERLGGASGPSLRDAAKSLSAEVRERHRAEMARVAVRALRIGFIHGGQHGSPVTAVQAAQLAFAALGDAAAKQDVVDGVESVDDSEATFTALWVLGRWTAEYKQWRLEDAMLKGVGFLEISKRASDVHQWPGHLTAARQRDFAKLLEGEPAAQSLIADLFRSAEMTPEEYQRYLDMHAAFESVDGCCREPQALRDLVLRPGIPSRGMGMGYLSDEQRQFLSQVVAASGQRLDLLVTDRHAWIANIESFSTSCVVAALALVGDKRGSRWHEGELGTEIRSIAVVAGKVATNTHWRDADPSSSLSGEMDATLSIGDVLFDFQAKAANSTKSAQRDKLLDSAEKQHRLARQALCDQGIALTRRSKDGSVQVLRPPLKLGENVLLHVPIVVGIDPRRAFGVGSISDVDRIERVVTTLDHLRLVNDVVEPLFRPIYWLERYFFAMGKQRYVDETDFLADWIDLSHGIPVEGKSSEGFIMSRNNRLGGYLSSTNSLSSVEDRYPEVRGDLRKIREEFMAPTPSRVAPLFTGVLKKVSRPASVGSLALLHAASRIGFASMDQVIKDRESCIFHSDGHLFSKRYMKWGVWRADTGPRHEKHADIDLLLIERSGRWSLKFSRDAVAEHWAALESGA